MSGVAGGEGGLLLGLLAAPLIIGAAVVGGAAYGAVKLTSAAINSGRQRRERAVARLEEELPGISHQLRQTAAANQAAYERNLEQIQRQFESGLTGLGEMMQNSSAAQRADDQQLMTDYINQTYSRIEAANHQARAEFQSQCQSFSAYLQHSTASARQHLAGRLEQLQTISQTEEARYAQAAAALLDKAPAFLADLGAERQDLECRQRLEEQVRAAAQRLREHPELSSVTYNQLLEVIGQGIDHLLEQERQEAAYQQNKAAATLMLTTLRDWAQQLDRQTLAAEEGEQLIETDFWSQGRYSATLEELSQLCQEIDQNCYDTEGLADLSHNAIYYQEELAAILNNAARSYISYRSKESYQQRISSALEKCGYQMTERAYANGDIRDCLYLKYSNRLGDELVCVLNGDDRDEEAVIRYELHHFETDYVSESVRGGIRQEIDLALGGGSHTQCQPGTENRVSPRQEVHQFEYARQQTRA